MDNSTEEARVSKAAEIAQIVGKLHYLFNRLWEISAGGMDCYRNLALDLSKHRKGRKQWGVNYLISVRSGSYPPGQPLIKAIEKEYARVKGTLPPRRYRLKIEAESKEQKESWMNLTMGERRDALDYWVKSKNSI
jgi:hypothetical protein